MLWPTAAARSGLSRIARKHGADRRAHDAQREHGADEIPKGQKRIERPVGVEVNGREAEIERRCRHAGQPVFTAGEVRERIELDEKKDLRDRHSDHRKVNSGAPERDQSDQITDDGRHDRADKQRRYDIGKIHDRQEIGRDHAAGAEERGLTEREQSGEAEQNVEAQSEQSPDQDAVDRGRREPEIRQDEWRGDQPDGRQDFNEEGALPEHQMTALIRGRPCRAVRRDAARAQASWRRTA